MATAPQPAQLTDVVAALRRHWTVVVIAAVVGLLLGALASFAIPTHYQATAAVTVNPMNTDPLNTSPDSTKSVNMATEQQLVHSRKVASRAAQLLLKPYDLSARSIMDDVTVETPQDSLVLSIGFTGSSAREAAEGADAMATAYLGMRRDTASGQVKRLQKMAHKQLDDVQDDYDDSSDAPALVQNSLKIQADELGQKLAELANLDLNPGQVVGNATQPQRRSTPGALPLGLAGLFLGLVAGVPLALTRKDEDLEIGGVDGLGAMGDQIVLDGTKDADRAETWDIAAFMLKIPQELPKDGPFMIMVDADPAPGRPAPGQELAESLTRRGRQARFVDAGAINEGKISRGWPTEKKRGSWAGEIVVIDTTNLSSDAHKVALATRSDSVLLARSTNDDAAALRRLAGLFRSKGVEVALTALFPARAELVTLVH